MTHCALLTRRTVLQIQGADAPSFLQNLVTCDIDGLAQDEASFGALLTPQGKVLFDFIIFRTEDSYLIDVADDQAEAFAKRLGFYKLRADVEIGKTDMSVHASWPNNAFESGFIDPRCEELGFRAYGESIPTNANGEDWNKLRILCGVPESGSDFQLGEVFPHDVLMDQFAGVDFQKGCYVGQEVVSRMHHRATARNRFMKLSSEDGADLVIEDGELQANDKKIGTVGSVDGSIGLALIRTDRAKAAMENGNAILLGTQTVNLERPGFAEFDWVT